MSRKAFISIVLTGLIAVSLFYLANTGLLTSGAKSGTETAKPEQAHTQEASAPPQKEEAQQAPAVELPADKQQMIGLKTTEASVRLLKKVIRTTGRIEYDERKLTTVNTKIEGWIEKLHIDYTGRLVKKGEPLAEIYSPELFATQQEFLNMLGWAKQGSDIKNENARKMLAGDADSIVQAARQRLRLWDITDEQVKKIEDSGAPLRTLTIYSPAGGYVVQKNALQGMRVMPGEKLFDIADMSTVWVISDIYEYELPFIRTGQQAKISLSYFPGRDFISKIDYVYPSLSAETRTAKVRFIIPNPGLRLKPQMFTNADITIDMGKRLSIPDEALIETGTRQIVYVAKEEGYFEPREVVTGLRTDGMVEILKGLKAGDKVASSAAFLIDSEAQLKGITPMEGHKH